MLLDLYFHNSQRDAHPGVMRLWMYQLYADAIEQDRKKREAVALPANKPQTAVKQPQITKKRPAKRAPEPVEQPAANKPLPVLARVFTAPPSTAIIDQVIASVIDAPLPLVPIVRKKVEKQEVAVDSPTTVDYEDEEFLLLAA